MSNQQKFQWKSMTAGVCYYPEHWPRELWAEDLERMKAAGLSVVRCAEFAWSIFEPAEGVFQFELFDSFLELCGEKGVQVILGTPTATPPVWLTEKYPEALNCNREGVPYRHGSRRHYNYNAPVYQHLCARVVEKMAQRYGSHLAVVGWQVDNELNCETDEFCSPADHAAFRAFLQDKYGTLERLNEAWGTVVWSQTYTDWTQIYGPRPVLNGGYNPSMLLDYYRFVSDSACRFCKLQADIIRKYKKPGDFITTNGMFPHLDNHRMTEESLDVYCYDSYPNKPERPKVVPQPHRDPRRQPPLRHHGTAVGRQRLGQPHGESGSLAWSAHPVGHAECGPGGRLHLVLPLAHLHLWYRDVLARHSGLRQPG